MMWCREKIARFCTTGSGGTPVRGREGYYGGGIPWVKSGELNEGIIVKTEESLTDIGLKESAAKLVPSGSVLVAMYGATIGKTAILGIDAATNQAICSIQPHEEIASSRYVWYALRNEVPSLLSKRVGGAQPNISQKIIRDTKLPLPAPSEQRKIVELMDQADNLRNLWAEADRKSERILPALFYKMFGDPRQYRGARKLGDMLGATHTRDPHKKPDKMFEYIDISGVSGKEGVIVNTKTILGADAPSRARKVVEGNDVIVSTVRPNLRATALVPHDYHHQICSTGFSVLRSALGCGHGFLYAYSRLQYFADAMTAKAKGGSYPAVSEADIHDLPAPNIDKVKLIRFDRMVESHLEGQQRRRRITGAIDDLFENMLYRAFSGDLTAKWREAHMKELLQEMEQQAKELKLRGD